MLERKRDKGNLAKGTFIFIFYNIMLSAGEKKTSLRYSVVTVFLFTILTAILYLQFQIYNLGTRMSDYTSAHNAILNVAAASSSIPTVIESVMIQETDAAQLSNISMSVCLIQGEYVFVNDGGEHVYWDEVEHVIYASNSTVSSDQNSQKIEIQYTGSGFLADNNGHIVTNKHVAMPWLEKSRDIELIKAGYLPQFVMFRAFFPGDNTPYDIEIAGESENDDLAILKLVSDKGYDVSPLPLCDSPIGVSMGDPVIIIGYPTGFDLLSASIDNNPVSLVYSDFAGLGQALADSELIYPMATRGICGQVYPGRVAYDAQTAIGASGSPVLNSKGQVVAVNTALLKGFAGTNFGIPVAKVISLLHEVQLQGR